MIKTDRRKWLNAVSASAAIFGLGLNAPAVAQDAGVHPREMAAGAQPGAG